MFDFSLFMSGICPLAFKDKWAYCIRWQRSVGFETIYKQRFLKKVIYGMLFVLNNKYDKV